MNQRPYTITFVCSGNVFRSMSAERMLRALSAANDDFTGGLRINSAGTHAIPQQIRGEVAEHLTTFGIVANDHRPRRLDDEIVESADLLVAMSYNHQEFIHDKFGIESPLFNRIAVDADTPILDVGEATPCWRDDPVAAQIHTVRVLDYLWSVMPVFQSRLAKFLPTNSIDASTTHCDNLSTYAQST